jgi:hypothetical protein
MEDNPALLAALSNRRGEVNAITTDWNLVVVPLGSLVAHLDGLSPKDYSGSSVNPTEVLFHVRTISEFLEIVGLVTGLGGLREREGWRGAEGG